MERHRNMEKPRNKPMHAPLLFKKGFKNTQGRKNSLFNKWYWEIGLPHGKE